MTSSFMLELSEDELTVLWGLMQVAQLDKEAGGPKRRFASFGRKMDKVDAAIESVTRKVNELMEKPNPEPLGHAGDAGSPSGGAL